MEDEADDPRPLSVALLVTCLVDLMRPNVGFAAVNLLQDPWLHCHSAPGPKLLWPARLQQRG
ncbi:MAG: hypothetical protein CM1200mP41_34370 [Gammaproteobacteria bacterium]|nr:MAG: hypothetical protein CM1200mP41_34370 [Gammaproteobacteria bacterium]